MALKRWLPWIIAALLLLPLLAYVAYWGLIAAAPDALVHRLSWATRVKVDDVGDLREPGPALFEESDAAVVRRLVADTTLLRNQGHKCSTGHRLRFYRGFLLLATVNFEHRRSLRWGGGGRHTWELDEGSSTAWTNWFRTHGATARE